VADSIKVALGRNEAAINNWTAAIQVHSKNVDTWSEAVGHWHTQTDQIVKLLNENLSGVPKLLEVIVRIGNVQLAIMEAIRNAAKNPFGPSNQIPQRDVVGANLEAAIDELRRSEGISREEAQLRLNTANAQSVWGEGNGIFNGWRG